MKTTRLGSLFFTLLLAGCVTINIYFPAAQARGAAEKIVEDILQSAPAEPGTGGQEKKAPPAADGNQSGARGDAADGTHRAVLDFFVSPLRRSRIFRWTARKFAACKPA